MAEQLGPNVATDPSKLDGFIVALHAFELFSGGKAVVGKRRHTEILPKVYAATVIARGLDEEDAWTRGQAAATRVQREWSSFLSFAAANGAKYVRTFVDPKTGEERPELKESRNAFGAEFQDHVETFFGIPSD